MMKPTVRGRGEMADALVLGTSGAIRKGSTPFVPTTTTQHSVLRFFVCIKRTAIVSEVR